MVSFAVLRYLTKMGMNGADSEVKVQYPQEADSPARGCVSQENFSPTHQEG